MKSERLKEANHMLKKSFWLAAIAVLAIGILAACGGGKDKEESTKMQKKQSRLKRVILSLIKKNTKFLPTKTLPLNWKMLMGITD